MRNTIFRVIIALLFLYSFTEPLLADDDSYSTSIGSSYSSPINQIGANAPRRMGAMANDDEDEDTGDWGHLGDPENEPLSPEEGSTPLGSSLCLLLFAIAYAIYLSAHTQQHKHKAAIRKSALSIALICSSAYVHAKVNFNGGKSCYVYFDNTNTNWEGKIYLVYGSSAHSVITSLPKIDSTNLYQTTLTQKQEYGEYMAIAETNKEVHSGDWGSDSLASKFLHYSVIYTEATFPSAVLITPSGQTDSPTLTFQTGDNGSVCNTSISLGIRYTLDGNTITADQMNTIITSKDNVGWTTYSVSGTKASSQSGSLPQNTATYDATIQAAQSAALHAFAKPKLARGYMFLGFYPDGNQNLSQQEIITSSETYNCTIPCVSSMYAVYGKKVNIDLQSNGHGTLTFQDGTTSKKNTLVSTYTLKCTPEPGYMLDDFTIDKHKLKSCVIEDGNLKMESNLDSIISRVSITANFVPSATQTDYVFYLLAPTDWEQVYLKIGSADAAPVNNQSGNLFALQINDTYNEGVSLQNDATNPTQSIFILPQAYAQLAGHTYTIKNNELVSLETTSIKQVSGESIDCLVFDAKSDITVSEATTVNDMYVVMNFEQSKCANQGILRYWFSLPFDCPINTIRGLDHYSEKWVIQRYRGDLRAEHGYTGSTFWRNLKNTATLEANRGYVLAINLSEQDFVDSIARLYFPGGQQTLLPTKEVTLPTCKSDNTNVSDWNWYIMGTPLLSNVDGAETTANLPTYIYHWNGTNYSIEASEDTTFTPLSGYMVQSDNTIHWAYEYAASAPKYMRQTTQERIKLGLMKNGKVMDKAFLTLSENATMDYDLGQDLLKLQESNNTTLCYQVNGFSLAAAALPLKTYRIPLNIEANESDNYSLRWLNLTETSDFIPYVYDSASQSCTALTADVPLTLAKGNYSNRFEIILTERGQLSTAITNHLSAPLYTTHGGIRMANIPLALPLQVYDAIGRLVFTGIVEPGDFISTPHGVMVVHLGSDTYSLLVTD